ncbi:isoleucine-tRNA ligase, partial [Spiromyces aspiralis]
PYRTLITHGFSLDEHGRKMSKSLGNVIAPRQITDGGKDKKKEPAYGMDVLRLWVSSMDYSQDMSLGPTIIAHMAENMRKLRNTLRFILGNLSDFNSGSIISYERLAPIDRYLLHELVQFKRRTTEAYDAYAFYQVLREINQFTNMTLSALYFDVVKDTLYADHPSDSRRLAAQTTLYY